MKKLTPAQLAALESRERDCEENLRNDYFDAQQDEDAQRRRFRKPAQPK